MINPELAEAIEILVDISAGNNDYIQKAKEALANIAGEEGVLTDMKWRNEDILELTFSLQDGTAAPVLVNTASEEPEISILPFGITQQAVIDPETGNVVVTCTFNYSSDTALLSLLWRPVLPEGWNITGVEGNGGPETGWGDIIFTAYDLSGPITFSYTIEGPEGWTGSLNIGGEVEYHFSGMINPELVEAINILVDPVSGETGAGAENNQNPLGDLEALIRQLIESQQPKPSESTAGSPRSRSSKPEDYPGMSYGAKLRWR